MLYGDQARLFDDELHPHIRHKKKGMVGMASGGKDCNASQFYITTGDELDSLDEKRTLFGEVRGVPAGVAGLHGTASQSTDAALLASENVVPYLRRLMVTLLHVPDAWFVHCAFGVMLEQATCMRNGMPTRSDSMLR